MEKLADRIKDTVNGLEIKTVTVTLEDGTKVDIDLETKKELLMYIGESVELAILKKEFITKHGKKAYQEERDHLEHCLICERKDIKAYLQLRLGKKGTLKTTNEPSIVNQGIEVLKVNSQYEACSILIPGYESFIVKGE